MIIPGKEIRPVDPLFCFPQPAQQSNAKQMLVDGLVARSFSRLALELFVPAVSLAPQFRWEPHFYT